MVFARSFYDNLFMGNSVKRSFESACFVVKYDPSAVRALEEKKYRLLPDGDAIHGIDHPLVLPWATSFLDEFFSSLLLLHGQRKFYFLIFPLEG